MLNIKMSNEIAEKLIALNKHGTGVCIGNKRWVSVDSLVHRLENLRTLSTEEIIVEIEELIKQLKGDE